MFLRNALEELTSRMRPISQEEWVDALHAMTPYMAADQLRNSGAFAAVFRAAAINTAMGNWMDKGGTMRQCAQEVRDSIVEGLNADREPTYIERIQARAPTWSEKDTGAILAKFPPLQNRLVKLHKMSDTPHKFRKLVQLVKDCKAALEPLGVINYEFDKGISAHPEAAKLQRQHAEFMTAAVGSLAAQLDGEPAEIEPNSDGRLYTQEARARDMLDQHRMNEVFLEDKKIPLANMIDRAQKRAELFLFNLFVAITANMTSLTLMEPYREKEPQLENRPRALHVAFNPTPS